MFYRYDNSPVLQGSQLHQQLHRLHLVNKTSLFFLLILDEVDGVGDGGLGVGGWRLLARLERLFIANYLLCELNYNLTLITISTLPNLYLTLLKYHWSFRASRGVSEMSFYYWHHQWYTYLDKNTHGHRLDNSMVPEYLDLYSSALYSAGVVMLD